MKKNSLLATIFIFVSYLNAMEEKPFSQTMAFKESTDYKLEDLPAHVFHQNLLNRASDVWNYPTEIEIIVLKEPPIEKGHCAIGDNIKYFRAREWGSLPEAKTIYEFYYWIQTDAFPRKSGWIGETPMMWHMALLHRNRHADFVWRR